MSVEIEEDSYLWTPNYFQIKDPNTESYVGNVIGNRSQEDQILIVSEAGADQKTAILEQSQIHISEIEERSKKFFDIMQLSNDAMKEILLYFGGTFVLDASVLDGTPLG